MASHSTQDRDFTRRSFLRMGLAGGALLAAPAFLSACGGGSGSSSSGTLKVGTALDVVDFDPYNQSISSLIILRNLNSWLLNYDESLRPHPDALQSYRIAADRRSVSMRIRDDVKFTTGKTMTVDDLVFAFERAKDPKRGMNLANAMTIVDTIKATTKQDVVLTFHQPIATSLITDLLAEQPVIDSDKNSIEALAKGPASAGPFRLAERSQGTSLTLEANPDWYGGKPKVDKVVIQVFNSPQAQVSALQSGGVDVAAYLAPNVATRVRGKGYTLLQGYPGSAIQLLRVSTHKPPFDDQAVRRALELSIDRARVVKEVLFGFGGAAQLPWGPHTPAYDPHYAAMTEFDLGKAKQLLASAKTSLTGKAMVSGSDPVSLNVMQILQSDLKKIGFTLDIEQAEEAAFETRLVAGDFGVAFGQMGGGELSAPRVVQNSLLRTSDNPLWPGGTPPEAYVRGMAELVTAQDPATRKAAYAQVNETLVEQAWAIPAYYVPTIFVSSSKVHGVQRDFQNALVLAHAVT